MPADSHFCTPLLAVGQLPPAKSLPLVFSQAGPGIETDLQSMVTQIANKDTFSFGTDHILEQ
jgi:hypothetical protein